MGPVNGPDLPHRTRRRAAAIVVTGAHEVLTHRLSRPAARTAARFTAAVALVGIARAAGVSWAELGLGRGELGSGVRTGAAAAAAAAAAVFAGAALPATRPFFLDKRAAAASGSRDLAAELARISFAAVPPEELGYRSALLGLWLGHGPPARAVAWSSVLFGLSHIPPTLSTMSGTALHDQLAERPLRQAAFVAGNVAVTGVAGAAFAWLRIRSGSVVAPLLAHAALNDAALVAGRVAYRLDHGASCVIRTPRVAWAASSAHFPGAAGLLVPGSRAVANSRSQSVWPWARHVERALGSFSRRAAEGILRQKPIRAACLCPRRMGGACLQGWPPLGERGGKHGS